MEKNILVEINRNLELMKVESLINESRYPARTNFINSFRQIFQSKKPPMFVAFVLNLTKLLSKENSNEVVNSIIFDYKISYDIKLKSLTKFLFGNENYDSTFAILCDKILETIQVDLNRVNLKKLILDSKSKNTTPNEIKDIIRNVFTNENFDRYLANDSEFKFLFIRINETYFKKINYLGNDKFYNFLHKKINDASTDAENLRIALNLNNDRSVDIGISELTENFNIIKDLLKSEKISMDFKNLLLLKYLDINSNNAKEIINLIIKKYIKDENFKKTLNAYIANQSNIELIFIDLYKDTNFTNKINTFKLDASKIEALINYIPFLVERGGLNNNISLGKLGNNIVNFLKKFSPALNKINIAHGMILTNQTKLHKTVNIEFMRLITEFNPKNNNTEIRLKAQQLYRGYIMGSSSNIYKNILEPLNELRKAKGISEIDKKTVDELISGITDPKESINFYLLFLQQTDIATGKNKYIEFLNVFNPFTNRSYDEILKQEKETLIEKFKQSLKRALPTMGKILLFGPQVNLKLLVKCILMYKKYLNKTPKPNIVNKSFIYIQMYLTYLLANYVYSILVSIYRPIVFGFATYLGLIFDELTQDFAKKYINTNYTGIVNDTLQKELTKDTQLFINPLFKSIQYELWLMITQNLTTQSKLNEMSFGLFLKHIGPNWYNMLLPPVFTNFEAGVFFRQIVNFYNWKNETDFKTFKSVLVESLSKIGKELGMYEINLEELDKENNTATLGERTLTYTFYNTIPTYIHVPNFYIKYIKTIKLNNQDIMGKVKEDKTKGIRIYSIGRDDAPNIVITSNQSNITYKLKNN